MSYFRYALRVMRIVRRRIGGRLKDRAEEFCIRYGWEHDHPVRATAYVVIDSAICRAKGLDPWSGLPLKQS
jgi:hypothetical protein